MAAETHWFNITALTGKEQLDPLEDWLWQQGAVSVTVEDAADNPIYEPPPGTQPVWEDVVVTGLFEAGVRPEEIVSGLEAEGFSGVLLHKLENRVWEREWLERFKPMQFGRKDSTLTAIGCESVCKSSRDSVPPSVAGDQNCSPPSAVDGGPGSVICTRFAGLRRPGPSALTGTSAGSGVSPARLSLSNTWRM